ncbi:MAG: hypothetical protein COW67_11350 [Flavobacteriales bacterium CG18_big_fil_WC_8_21_14_2_50_32_9]|nr:MAG: hypothetical protein COW67_11350 [Flavobacteriales bacterium CG18_big_fil_WC_8_21_14_2_50_32_9]PIZ05555.1 MAG: hypothetical protein COY57_06645 [Flavobacteriales bacterium CG_4_10_14_0_8_um_filter_32_5]PJC63175.1 MAG: hypothetical protein CO022_00650 [Flavobacteriales bacterium CG_4_9_14_0_2_um_filter_32_27]
MKISKEVGREKLEVGIVRWISPLERRARGVMFMEVLKMCKYENVTLTVSSSRFNGAVAELNRIENNA